MQQMQQIQQQQMFQQKQMQQIQQMQQMMIPLNQQMSNQIVTNIRSTSPTLPFQKLKPTTNQMNQ